MKIDQKYVDRFWSKVNKSNNCWNWEGTLDRDGYGHFGINYKIFKAHRFSSLLAGNDPQGYVVCHTCDNPACVNPNHLVLASQEYNMKDMAKKGRSTKGIAKEKYQCVHCFKEVGGAANLNRWHNDNCKNKKDLQI
jgi:hypothetical protein